MAKTEKKKTTHFKNISKGCTVGIPPGGNQDHVVHIAGLPFFFPPGKIIHDENGIMFPILTDTSDRYFVQCEAESEMIELGVPPEARESNGFRGIAYIMKALDGDALAAEKDRAVLSQTEYDVMRAKASMSDGLVQDLAKAREMVAVMQAEVDRVKARAADVAKYDAVAAENVELKEQVAALGRDLAKASKPRRG